MKTHQPGHVHSGSCHHKDQAAHDKDKNCMHGMKMGDCDMCSCSKDPEGHACHSHHDKTKRK